MMFIGCLAKFLQVSVSQHHLQPRYQEKGCCTYHKMFERPALTSLFQVYAFRRCCWHATKITNHHSKAKIISKPTVHSHLLSEVRAHYPTCRIGFIKSSQTVNNPQSIETLGVEISYLHRGETSAPPLWNKTALRLGDPQ